MRTVKKIPQVIRLNFQKFTVSCVGEYESRFQNWLLLNKRLGLKNIPKMLIIALVLI